MLLDEIPGESKLGIFNTGQTFSVFHLHVAWLHETMMDCWDHWGLATLLSTLGTSIVSPTSNREIAGHWTNVTSVQFVERLR